MQSPSKQISLTDNLSIIEALKNSNTSVFEQIYRYYYKGLCAFSSQYVSQTDSEEIVQDTMMWIWENRAQLNSSLNLKSLLFTMVKNKALNKINHQKIKFRVHQEIVDKYATSFENPDFYLENELFQLYRSALAKLPDDFQLVYDLNRNMNLTHKEIALKLNISPQTVNYRISQVLKALRIELKDYLDVQDNETNDKKRSSHMLKSLLFILTQLLLTSFFLSRGDTLKITKESQSYKSTGKQHITSQFTVH